MHVFTGFSGIFRGLWAVVGSCGRFLVLLPIFLGFMGFSLGNHYLILCEKVWLRVVNVWIMFGFCSFFVAFAEKVTMVTMGLP